MQFSYSHEQLFPFADLKIHCGSRCCEDCEQIPPCTFSPVIIVSLAFIPPCLSLSLQTSEPFKPLFTWKLCRSVLLDSLVRARALPDLCRHGWGLPGDVRPQGAAPPTAWGRRQHPATAAAAQGHGQGPLPAAGASGGWFLRQWRLK